jgi:hypothetical protein
MIAEAAVVASAKAVEAISNLVSKIIEGQTPEQRKVLWDWYIEDMSRWRKLWGLGDE